MPWNTASGLCWYEDLPANKVLNANEYFNKANSTGEWSAKMKLRVAQNRRPPKSAGVRHQGQRLSSIEIGRSHYRQGRGSPCTTTVHDSQAINAHGEILMLCTLPTAQGWGRRRPFTGTALCTPPFRASYSTPKIFFVLWLNVSDGTNVTRTYANNQVPQIGISTASSDVKQ